MNLSQILKYLQRLLRSFFLKKKIGCLGKNCNIAKYYCIEGENVFIGNNVTIAEGAWIKTNPILRGRDVELNIGDGCNIGRFNEIYSTRSIVLENKVLTAEHIYISDNLHDYRNPYIPIMDQPVTQNRTVRIGEGSWIGSGAAILGVHIGKHCVIGANAVVTKDIPDYSVAVGIPAKVIKRYNPRSKKWERTNPDGSFIHNS